MSKIPVLEEISLNSHELDYIRDKLEEMHAGSTPLYINLSKSNKSELLVILDRLESVMRNMGIHPLLPYPFYVLTKEIEKHSFFPIRRDSKDLPEYFKLKAQRPKSHEQELLQKIAIMNKKISNGEVEEKLKLVRTQRSLQRQLFNINSENDFYARLIKIHHKKKDKKNAR